MRIQDVQPVELKTCQQKADFKAAVEKHSLCAGAPEQELSPQCKSAPPPRKSDPAGTNE